MVATVTAPDEAPPAPVDEGAWLDLGAEAVAQVASDLPLGTRFRLREAITPVQACFLQRHGFLLFDRVASQDEVAAIGGELKRIEAELLEAGTRKVYGVPVWFGRDPDGRPWLQRMGFASTMSGWLAGFVRDPRFEPIRTLIGADARIGDREKDGLVVNRYVNSPGSLRPGLAWHTDALRDVFYNRAMPGPMLNVGLHLDRVRAADGGLRLLPGTHRQSAWSTLFSKVHFVTQAPDPREIAVETWPGDLTVHDGRMWHRVAANPQVGWASLRRSLYVPYVCDSFAPKEPHSGTPAYLRFFDAVMRLRGWLFDRRS